ncbi:MAG: ComEC/Rec2 family competence protein [Promethearchaeota archaeon]
MKLRVRAYNVEFGDAILISIPEKDQYDNEIYKHILIDVGNRGTPNDNRLFEPVIDDIKKELNGNPLDLYVMTHEHLDHVQGLPYVEKNLYGNKTELLDLLEPKHSWFPISSDDNSDAKLKMDKIITTLKNIDTYLESMRVMGVPIGTHFETLWAINNIGRTRDCVNYLLKFEGNCFIHRDFITEGHHPFSEAEIRIWAPEKDITTYFSNLTLQSIELNKRTVPLIPPHGVDASTFFELVASREGFYENLLAANSSINNTSIVFCIKWRGNRLLFTGDAEEQSWKAMKQNNVLEKVNFLKVSHHGSHNGTPDTDILDIILPLENKEEQFALVSTAENVYDTVPDDETLRIIEERCNKLYRLNEITPGEYQDIFFEPKT